MEKKWETKMSIIKTKEDMEKLRPDLEVLTKS